MAMVPMQRRTEFDDEVEELAPATQLASLPHARAALDSAKDLAEVGRWWTTVPRHLQVSRRDWLKSHMPRTNPAELYGTRASAPELAARPLDYFKRAERRVGRHCAPPARRSSAGLELRSRRSSRAHLDSGNGHRLCYTITTDAGLTSC